MLGGERKKGGSGSGSGLTLTGRKETLLLLRLHRLTDEINPSLVAISVGVRGSTGISLLFLPILRNGRSI